MIQYLIIIFVIIILWKREGFSSKGQERRLEMIKSELNSRENPPIINLPEPETIPGIFPFRESWFFQLK